MTHYYDAHDTDTVASLSQGVIKVSSPDEPPRMAFFLVPQRVATQPDEVPTINFNVEGYVRMVSLSKELQDRVRDELGIVPVKFTP